MNARLLYAATLALAVVSTAFVGTSALADATPARAAAPLTRAEVRAELALAIAQRTLRHGDAEPPLAASRVAAVAQWRVREEARAVVRDRLRRDPNHDRF